MFDQLPKGDMIAKSKKEEKDREEVGVAEQAAAELIGLKEEDASVKT